MCGYFEQRMDNYQAGDLTDIVRASGGGGGGFSGDVVADWQFPADPMNYPSGIEEPVEDFGDPFSNMRDPLLNELDIPSSSFFNNSSTNMMKTTTVEDTTTTTTTTTGFCCGDVFSQKIVGVDEEEMMMIKKRPCNNNNIFSRMLQISPNATKLMPISSGDSPVLASPRGIKVSPLVANDLISTNASTKSCLVENSGGGSGGGGGGVQISSPRNTGIKRRKSQAKKVVCIPAPAPANSRPSGEVVPSDLWAWRKYGQKPIKGSPYPRGYYRCSSSKGCSARKQVERSRTDPNMLVITYTSEHNHPWPTQRNALAGSTRTQPTTKNNNNSKNSSSISSQSQIHKPTPGGGLNNNKEEQHKEKTNTTGTSTAIKEEILEDIDHQSQSQAHNDDHDHDDDHEHDQDHEDDEFLSSEGVGFPFPAQSYRPALPDHSSNFNNLLQSHHNEDFFADLGEIEADLLFTQGFSEEMMMIRPTGNNNNNNNNNNNKALDPFTSLFDWNGNNNHHTSFGEANRGL